MRMKLTQKKLLSLLLSTFLMIGMIVSPFSVITAAVAQITVLPTRTIDLTKGEILLHDSTIPADGAVQMTLFSTASRVSSVFWTDLFDEMTYDGDWARADSYDLNNDGTADIVYDGYYSGKGIIRVAQTSTAKGTITYTTPKSYIDKLYDDAKKYSGMGDTTIYEALTFIFLDSATTTEPSTTPPSTSEATDTTPAKTETPVVAPASTATPAAPTAEEIIAQFDISKTYTAKEADAVAKDFVNGLKTLGVAIVPEFTEQVATVNPVLGQALKSALGQTPASETPAESTPKKEATAPAAKETADAPPADTPAAAGGSYTVEQGDSLFKIAKKAYGDGKLWKKIYEANKDQIRNAKEYIIYAGQSFVIPTIQ